jgi:hypothetical protein
MTIPDKLIPDAYELSKKVLEGNITSSEAADRLSGKDKMVRGSAAIYITVFQQLIQGKKITYTLNAASIEYCLQNILKDYGPAKFSKALTVLKEHIDYCEKRSNSHMSKLRSVYNKSISKK